MRVRATRNQLQTLERLKKFLGEQGYVIAPVALWYRRNPNDFVAIPDSHLETPILVIRLGRNRIIEIRPYYIAVKTATVRERMSTSFAANTNVRWRWQLPREKDRGGPKSYVVRYLQHLL